MLFNLSHYVFIHTVHIISETELDGNLTMLSVGDTSSLRPGGSSDYGGPVSSASSLPRGSQQGWMNTLGGTGGSAYGGAGAKGSSMSKKSSTLGMSI